MKHLENKVIVVAGATGGIGSAAARHLARQGARVILAARSYQTMRQLLAEVRAFSPGSEAFEGDLCQKLLLTSFIYLKLSIFQRHHAQHGVFPEIRPAGEGPDAARRGEIAASQVAYM